MMGLGHANSYVTSRSTIGSHGMLARKHNELVDRSMHYQTQGYYDHQGEEYMPPSAGTSTRRKSPALRKLESGKQRAKASYGVPLRPNHMRTSSPSPHDQQATV